MNVRTKVSPDKIIEIGEQLYDSMSDCQLCPMECRVNRLDGELGECQSGDKASVASFNLHFGEEPSISCNCGSGTIFLSNCSLSCKYCQNYPISQHGNGSEVSTDEMAKMMLNLQKRGAENINFVTPDHMIPMILIALGQAKNDGLEIPIVYNCSGYAKVEILNCLNGIIDVYLVDMRYSDDNIAEKYSGCENYTETNRLAIKEIFAQVGNLKINQNGRAESGMIIRHLVLPGQLSGSEKIFDFLVNEISDDVYVSLMSQYFPAFKAVDDKIINRRLSTDEFQQASDAFFKAGLKNGYIQNYSNETNQ